MFDYTYPVHRGGYAWNIKAKCYFDFALMPLALRWNKDNIVISFDRELTAPEKIKLDAIMVDPATAAFPGLPSFPGTKFIIKDIWKRRADLNTGGRSFAIFFSESVPGTSGYDQIEIHFVDTLNTSAKNVVKAGYAGMIAEKTT